MLDYVHVEPRAQCAEKSFLCGTVHYLINGEVLLSRVFTLKQCSRNPNFIGDL